MNLDFLKTFKWKEVYSEQAHVLAMQMALENRTKLMQQSVGTSFKALLITVKNNFATLYFNPEDSTRVAQFIVHRITTEEGWAEEVFKEIYKRAEQLLHFSRSLINKDYSMLKNEELFELYASFVQYFVGMRLYSSIPTNADMDTNTFTNFLQTKLAIFIPSGTKEFNEAFSVLTTPHTYSYLKEREQDLLRLGMRWGEQNFDQQLDEFTKKYTWTNYTFQGVPITKEEFCAEVKELVEKGTNFTSELVCIEEEKKKVIQQQTDLVTHYGLDQRVVRFFSYGREFVFFKFFRKGVFAESYYCSEFLLREIAKRLHTSLEVVQGMLFDEVRMALQTEDFDSQVVESRMRDGRLLAYEGKFFNVPSEYRSIVQKNLNVFTDREQKELKGQTAVVGKATGVVRLINSRSDLHKIATGDIMVSRSTNPDLLPAMKKAAAIITDLGGLTCHAAIVSRELGVPCIVGTEIATKILKDGDRVEVDADHGKIYITN